MSTLAMHGGRPVREEPWPQYPIYGEKEKSAAAQVIDSNWLVAHHNPAGPGKVEAFEEAFRQWTGFGFAIGLGNGTEGLHLALAAADIGVNDEVIVPTITFVATATAVLMQNAVPVFADSETETLGLDPEAVAAKITSRTRAVIPVHLCGYPAKMDELMHIAWKHDLVVIEDCSHAHGALYHGRKVGTIGHIGVFSLQQKKNLSTGDGGLVVTDNEEYADAIRRLRTFGHAELSYNYRMTEIAAAIGQVRLALLDEHNRIRRANARHMEEALDGLRGITVRRPTPETVGVYYSLLLEYDPEAFAGVARNDFIKAVQAEGIPLSTSYSPVHRLNTFHLEKTPARGCPWTWALYTASQDERPSYDDGCCPVAEDYCDNRLMELKVHPPVGWEEIAQAAEAIRKVVAHLAAGKGL